MSRRATLVTAVAVLVTACAEGISTTAPPLPEALLNTQTASLPTVRIAEFHYDNFGPNIGEAIEISGPAGTSLAGWSLVLYNGSGGGPYTTTPLSGSIPASCGTRGVRVVHYPTDAIQNGNPDGIALVDDSGALVEFLSYEGSFVGVGGPANGRSSRDVGVFEMGIEPPGMSLQRTPGGGWSPPGMSSLGVCNDGIGLPPANTAPVARVNGPFTSLEGSTVAMSGSASTDAEKDTLSYAWTFGDGTSASGVSQSHTYVQDGSYTVTLTVSDAKGLTHTVTTTAKVSNVSPQIAAFAGATILAGESWSAPGSFTDPGADAWSATVDYGMGGQQTLALTGKSFALSHQFNTSGTFTVSVRVSDDDATSLKTQEIVVLSIVESVNAAVSLIDDLVNASKLNRGLAKSLRVRLATAGRQLERGEMLAARMQLQAIRAEVDQLVKVGHLTATDAAPLQTFLDRMLNCLLGGQIPA